MQELKEQCDTHQPPLRFTHLPTTTNTHLQHHPKNHPFTNHVVFFQQGGRHRLRIKALGGISLFSRWRHQLKDGTFPVTSRVPVPRPVWWQYGKRALFWCWFHSSIDCLLGLGELVKSTQKNLDSFCRFQLSRGIAGHRAAVGHHDVTVHGAPWRCLTLQARSRVPLITSQCHGGTAAKGHHPLPCDVRAAT